MCLRSFLRSSLKSSLMSSLRSPSRSSLGSSLRSSLGSSLGSSLRSSLGSSLKVLSSTYSISFTYRWFPTATLTNERYYGSSVLTPDGDLWVLGGTHASKTADSTEVLEYKPRPATGRFRKGFPLPTELRDTGKCKRKQTILIQDFILIVHLKLVHNH